MTWVLHAEWTKFRTVRAWLVAMAVATLLPALLLLGSNMRGSCNEASCKAPVGPGGEVVSDDFYFVHQTLTGDGEITTRVTSLTGRGIGPQAGHGAVAWAKAGIIVKASTARGSAYAAMMVTGAHGVRMQDDFTHDIAGLPGRVSPTSPRWLRLTRSGDTVTGRQSADGAHWSVVGTAHLPHLPASVQIGLFAASPDNVQISHSIGSMVSGGPAMATATFDHVSLPQGGTDGLKGDRIGGPDGLPPELSGGFRSTGTGQLTVSGQGDIAPDVPPVGFGTTIENALTGTFAALIVVVVVGTVFVTTEYRRGLIRTTLAASPHRGRVLAGKALVLAGVTFVSGLGGTALAVWLGLWKMRSGGVYVFPVSLATGFRLIVGTAALLAIASVLALAVGTLLRRSAAAVATVVVTIVLPYLLSVTVLPPAASAWVLRIAPAAAFAVQQTVPRYSQVTNDYSAASGFYPLPPLAGFAVLCVWAAFALGLAAFALKRRDA